MERKVLLIGAKKSFMVNAIARGLQNEKFEVIQCELSKYDILAVEKMPELCVLYLGDLDRENPDKNGIQPLKCLNERIDTERFYLYEVGSTDELKYAAAFLPKIKVTETFTRPLDVKLLADNLETAIQNNQMGEDYKKKILVVDDDGTILRMIKTWLSVKYRVYMASSGTIALNFLQSNTVDLVLLDYMMPQMDGPEVLRQIRMNPQLEKLPVMFLTSKGDRDSVITVAPLKPEKYILKTMPKDKLVRSIDDFFYVLK